MDAVAEVIDRIGVTTPQEKEAWRKIIEGVTTVVLYRIRRRVEANRSRYRELTEEEIKTRIKEHVVTWMLDITAAINKIQEFLDYPRV